VESLVGIAQHALRTASLPPAFQMEGEETSNLGVSGHLLDEPPKFPPVLLHFGTFSVRPVVTGLGCHVEMTSQLPTYGPRVAQHDGTRHDRPHRHRDGQREQGQPHGGNAESGGVHRGLVVRLSAGPVLRNGVDARGHRRFRRGLGRPARDPFRFLRGDALVLHQRGAAHLWWKPSDDPAGLPPRHLLPSVNKAAHHLSQDHPTISAACSPALTTAKSILIADP